MISVALASEHALKAAEHVADAHHGGFIHDPTFWVAISFVIVVASLSRPISRGFKTAMRVRAEKIKLRLEQARKLREDTQILLSECQHKSRNAEQESKEILEKSKKDAEKMKNKLLKELEASFVKKEWQAIAHIEQAEKQAMQEIYNLAVDISISAAKDLIKKDITAKQSDALIDSFIEELPDVLSANPIH